MKKKKEPKIWVAAMVFMALMLASVYVVLAIGVVSATTWYVEEGESIQAAVDAAKDGDTIIVRNGTYTENINVYKRLTIQSENGSENCVVQAANLGDRIFDITVDYVNISGFTVKGTHTNGIYLRNAEHCNIFNNNVSNNVWGIGLYFSSNKNTIANNAVLNNDHGIELDSSSNNLITNNIVNSNIQYGVNLDSSSNNMITNNIILSNNGEGIRLDSSSNNTIINNSASNNGCIGILLVHLSSNNTISNNIANLNSHRGIYLDSSSNNSIMDNVVNLNNDEGIYLESSCNNNIANNTESNNYEGIFLWYSSNNRIANNNVSNNYYGISLYGSSNNTITNNTFINDGLFVDYSYQNTVENNTVNSKPLVYLEDILDYTIPNAQQVILVNCDNITVDNMDLSKATVGAELWNTTNSKITNNNVSNNWVGIYLRYSGNNAITNNNASNNRYGVILSYSSNNTLNNNNALNNNDGGICLHSSSNSNTLTNNIASNNGYGIDLHSSSNNTIMNNTANWNNGRGIELTSSNNNTLTNNIVKLNSICGVLLDKSSYNILRNNNANSNNINGIELVGSSSKNTIMNNNVSANNYYGIRLYSSSKNSICLNNFIDNCYNFYSYNSTNIWNSTPKITYTYNESTYTNYLGNYWSDYTDVDANDDGIWDNPRGIDSDWDYHPLVEPFENYPTPTETIFDTGKPANPYPSIMGNHTGTIKPNHAIVATKLYTYPCIGTGGHIEYAKIWNLTWNATATWTGYAGDWHNITFDRTVVLLGNEEYNYTIHTGSYPRIIHESPFNATGGEITCTKFTDANGKVYYDWIPAIRLWA